jgi:hypothetical protein
VSGGAGRSQYRDSARGEDRTGDAGQLDGSATVTVDFRNMPRGVQTGAKVDGAFKQYNLNRGRGDTKRGRRMRLRGR